MPQRSEAGLAAGFSGRRYAIDTSRQDFVDRGNPDLHAVLLLEEVLELLSIAMPILFLQDPNVLPENLVPLAFRAGSGLGLQVVFQKAVRGALLQNSLRPVDHGAPRDPQPL